MSDFDNYQNWTRSTAIYKGAEEGVVSALMYCALGLVGEAGEVADKIKKIYRDNTLPYATNEQVTAISKEIGDVVWYIARLCDELGVSFHDVVRTNVEKLSSRKDRGVLGGSGDER